jgi:hypothetical protein
MPELSDIYSNFFSDEHMCTRMRAAESDGAGRRGGEEKSGATLYDGMQLVENCFALVGEEESEGRRSDYTVQRLAWSVFSILTIRLQYVTPNYISQAFIFIASTADRSYFSETTPASRTLVRSLIGLFNSAPGSGGVDRVVVVLRDKISWSNSLFIQAWCVTTFPYHIPPLTDDPVHSRCTQV